MTTDSRLCSDAAELFPRLPSRTRSLIGGMFLQQRQPFTPEAAIAAASLADILISLGRIALQCLVEDLLNQFPWFHQSPHCVPASFFSSVGQLSTTFKGSDT